MALAEETLPIRIVETTITTNEAGQNVSVLPARYVDADADDGEAGNVIPTVPFEEVEGLIALNSAGKPVPVVPVRIVDGIVAANELGALVPAIALRGTGGTPTPTPAPSWSVEPSISGTPTVGETLTGSDGTISNGTVSARAWLRGSSAISGATGATYLLVEADEGEDISYRVTATGAGGSAQATSDPVGPIAPAPDVTAPTINAPTLILLSVTDYPPPLEVSFDETVQEGDVLRVQSSATVDFASPIINDTSTLDAAAISSGQLSVTGLSSIESPDETYFRGRTERGAYSSAWSIIVKHGDTTAPVFTSSASPTVNENVVNPTGTLTFSDPGDVVSVIISGGADSDLFSLGGLTWALNATPDYETKSSYVVQFRATDYGGNSATQTMTLGINDVAEITPSTFSSTAKGANITLSNGDLTASHTLTNNGSIGKARVTNARTGKRFCQFTVTAIPTGNSYVGVGPSTAAWTTTNNDVPGIAATPAGSSLQSSGAGRTNGTFTSNVTPAWAVGDIISMCFEEGTHKIWYGHTPSGGSTINWNGNPDAETGGFTATGMDAYFAFVGMTVKNTDQRALTFHPIADGIPIVGDMPTDALGYDQ